jgi:hypothetical protein
VTRLSWGDYGSRFYEAGVDRGVLYTDGSDGVPWNGLTSVTETATGGAAKPYYIDGEKYLNVASREEYQATLTAYTYPEEFSECDGSVQIRPGLLATKQQRKSFDLSYRTLIGNDQTVAAGYKIHLIYGVLASPSARVYKSTSNSVDPDDFSWTLTSLPPAISGYKRTSHFIIDSRFIDPDTLSGIEDILYGNDETASRIPDVSEIMDLIDSGDHLTVTILSGGKFSMTAPIADLVMLDIGTFQVTWPTVIDNFDGTYTATSS